MDELEKFVDKVGKMLEMIEIEKVRKDKFIDLLVRELEQVGYIVFS